MNLKEALDRALEEDTVLDALSFLAIWEGERAIRQRDECLRTGTSTASHEGTYDTCYRATFEALFRELGWEKIAALSLPGRAALEKRS